MCKTSKIIQWSWKACNRVVANHTMVVKNNKKAILIGGSSHYNKCFFILLRSLAFAFYRSIPVSLFWIKNAMFFFFFYGYFQAFFMKKEFLFLWTTVYIWIKLFLCGDFEQHTFLQTLNKISEKFNTPGIHVCVCFCLKGLVD